MVLALSRMIFPSWAKAGILTSLIVLPLPSYGHIYRIAKTVDIIGRHRVLQAMTNILSTSRAPPVIILQGDHGIPRVPNASERDGIVEAYYFPGEGRHSLYDAITPVNPFRLIFNTYLGGTFPLLPDLSLISNPAATPFQFTPSPETSPACSQH